MPFYDDNPLEHLALSTAEAEQTLDLRGLEAGPAMLRVERLLQTRSGTESWLIRFDPATDDGRETLFLPLGRRLLDARRDGTLTHCLPVANGTGYVITFAS